MAIMPSAGALCLDIIISESCSSAFPCGGHSERKPKIIIRILMLVSRFQMCIHTIEDRVKESVTYGKF